MQLIQEHPEVLSMDQKGQMIVEGHLVKDTNMLDLVHCLYSSSTVIPRGLPQFTSALETLNIPQTYIANKKLFPVLAELKSSFDTGTLTSYSSKVKASHSTPPPGEHPKVLKLYRS